MKKLWLVSAALAAQLASPAMAADYPAIPPVYAPPAPPTYAPPPPPAIYSWWTGCYLGGNLGGDWTRAFYTQNNSVFTEDFTLKVDTA